MKPAQRATRRGQGERLAAPYLEAGGRVDSEDALAAFVADHGWRYAPNPERFDFGARYLRPVGLDDSARAHPVEFMALIEREPR